MAAPENADGPQRPGKLPRAVVGLGFVSLFTDISSEAIFPLMPAFLVALGASNAFIGLIEGAADFVSSILKYQMGRVADRRARLKPLILAGYAVSTIARPLVGFATFPWHVLAIRIGDRVGKGVRSSPRDAMIAAAAPASMRARAYGFHRAMDHTGAALGTLFAAGLLWWLGATSAETATVDQMRTVFLWAAVPGVFALIALAVTPEPPRPPPSEEAASEPLPPALKRALVPITMFAFANATDAFLLVKASSLGAAPLLLPFLWLALHVVKATTATFGGRLADRYGKRNALALGWTVYAVTWGAVGIVPSLDLLFVLVALYGTSTGLVEGAEKALVSELAAGGGSGHAFGAYNMLLGFAALAASTAFGVVWDQFGAALAFALSGGTALAAAATLLALVRR